MVWWGRERGVVDQMREVVQWGRKWWWSQVAEGAEEPMDLIPLEAEKILNPHDSNLKPTMK